MHVHFGYRYLNYEDSEPAVDLLALSHPYSVYFSADPIVFYFIYFALPCIPVISVTMGWLMCYHYNIYVPKDTINSPRGQSRRGSCRANLGDASI